MPRMKLFPEPPAINRPELIDELAGELTTDREFGQPLVVEQPFGGTSDTRVTVFWDRFESVPDEERTRIIIEAYRRVAPQDVDAIAVALGLTFLEAEEEWLLPYEVTPNWRKSDTVTLEACYDAMRQLGASTLRSKAKPVLRLPTAERAQASARKLKEILPGTDDMWTIIGHMRGAG